MRNDTPVYDVVHLGPDGEARRGIGSLGTREAIRRDGLQIDATSLAFCPHEWIDSSGYVDLELVRKFPLMLAL